LDGAGGEFDGGEEDEDVLRVAAEGDEMDDGDGDRFEVEDDFGEEDDDEDEDEDEDAAIRDIGNHALMDRVQARLFKRLTDQEYRLSLELREKEEELRRLRSKREQVGVELYNVQQQLAKLQLQLENAHAKFQEAAAGRGSADEALVQMRDAFKARQADVEEARRKLEKNQAELDALNATLRQVEAYNEEMQSEIKVVRRATYKAEESVTEVEKEKRTQDLYIDQLNERLKRLHEQHALYEAQLQAQQRETEAAVQTLREAEKEMEGLSFEKKQLMQQWQSSLIGVQRRDEALQATHDAIRKQREAELAMQAEVRGYKKGIREEQEKNEQLTGVLQKLEGEAKRVEEEIGRLTASKEKLAERYELLRRSLEQTDKEAQRAAAEIKTVRDQIAAVDQKYQVVERERRKVEDQIAETRSTQTTVSKAVVNLHREAAKLQEKVHAKEVERESMLNELSRIRVDMLNTEAHNAQLQESLDTLLAELREKERLIEKYELEIRQRNDEIEKKMHTVDKLNRRYEMLTADKEDINTGPLEATINNLSKQIGTLERQNQELQQQWLRRQTELVAVSKKAEKESEVVGELGSERTVLDQKRLRTDRAIEAAKREVVDLQKSIQGMHGDMTRLNQLIARNKELQARLENANFASEQEFMEELKELERDSRGLDSQLEALVREKDKMLEDMVEVERQVMLWEKKTLLEKETQAALDPEVGQAETRSMEKEIHRMRLRYEALKRDQERLIAEMERAIEKHESIELRHKGRKALQESRGLAAAEDTRAGLKKKLRALRNTLKKTKEEARSYEAATRQKDAELSSLALELERAGGEYSRCEDDANELQRAINDALYEKQRCMDQVSKYRRDARRYGDLARRGPGPAPRPAETMAIEREVAAAEQEREAVRDVIKSLSQQFEKLSEVLDRVHLLTEV